MVMSMESSVAVEFGLRMRSRRKELGLTLRGLADACGMGPTSIWQVEHGASMPGIDTALKIARALEVPVGWLIAGDGPEPSGREMRIAAAMSRLRKAIES